MTAHSRQFSAAATAGNLLLGFWLADGVVIALTRRSVKRDVRNQGSRAAASAGTRKSAREPSARRRRKFYEVRCRVRSHADRYSLLNGDKLFPGYGRPDATPAERSVFLKPEVPFRDFPETPIAPPRNVMNSHSLMASRSRWLRRGRTPGTRSNQTERGGDRISPIFLSKRNRLREQRA